MLSRVLVSARRLRAAPVRLTRPLAEVAELLKQGAEPDWADSTGLTALHRACYAGRAEAARAASPAETKGGPHRKTLCCSHRKTGD